ncbi:DUF6292 family protein [Amycolatopsis thermoflava]|uniref:DUF6292 family protein n=1 Tax=Amycolatopsis thermoflava TaxID=84480 RepID=UPI003EB97EEB
MWQLLATKPEKASPAERALRRYVLAVADEVGVPRHVVACEVSDQTCAYLGLTRRSPGEPDADLMLVWTPREGWFVAVEAASAVGSPRVLGYLGTAGQMPGPGEVAAFVDSIMSGGRGASAPVSRLREGIEHFRAQDT